MTSPYVTGDIGTFGLSGSSKINALAWPGFKWGSDGAGTSAAISYSFPTNGSLWHSDYMNYLDNEPNNNFQPFDAAQQNAARQALALWSDVANITFTEVDDGPGDGDVGDIRFGNSGAVTNSTSAAWAYSPYDDIPYEGFVYAENGDVWFDYQYEPNLQLAPGEFGFSTMIHEIGHAIGLDHPFNDGYGRPETFLPASQNNQRYSIMAYATYAGATIEAYGPMLYDILALQYIYGANTTTRAGDDVYTFLTDKEYLECIWDAGGHDTIDLSDQFRNQVIDLRDGTFSSIGIKNNGQTGNGNVSIAFNVTIEDAIGGSGNDKITGNNADNSLEGRIGNDTMVGGAGNDTLDGGAGIDSMTGEAGNDLYRVTVATDKVIETLTLGKGGGVDTVESAVTYSLAALANVENLVLLGTGNFNATGNAAGNALTGNDGSNILDGKAGADILKGGAGNDVYILDHAGDLVDEEGNADAFDQVKTTALIAAAITGIEKYTYTGTKAWNFTADSGNNEISSGSAGDTIKGGAGNDIIFGNGGNDTLLGELGDDWLDGGLGNDKLFGGAGNDVYVLSAVGDFITDEGADIDDEVRSTVKVDLALLAGGLVEHATLLGAGAISALGNGASNILTGNTGANILDGRGGADVLTGGKGADTYFVDDGGDQVFESIAGATGGIDTVKSSIDFDLVLLGNVEKLTLLAGFGDLDAIGNALNNTLTGNEGANILNGGIGKDTMAGGAGNDYYFVDNIGDVVTETIANGKGGGFDTVESSVTYSLAARVNVDHLILTGSGNSNGTGNALNNQISGNDGKNVLNGGTGNDELDGGNANDTLIGGTGNDFLTGGDGIDKMTGGTGSDTFDFNLVSELGDGDTIVDFKRGVGGDFLDISDLLVGYNDQFDEFVSFTYIGTATNVFVDADGLDVGFAPIQLANLSNVHLTSADSASFIVETV